MSDTRITWAELTAEEQRISVERIRLWDTQTAWHRWRLESCSEFNGGHDVRLRFDHGDWSIACAHGCPLSLDDYYPDGSDVTFADIPVTVEVETVHYRGGPWGPDEWDVTIGLEPRCRS
jgi:hypothetical protein